MSSRKGTGQTSLTDLGWLRSRLWIGGLIVLVLLGLIGVLILEDHFGPIDPTDPGWKARVVNDLGIPIDVRSSAVDLKLAPGESDIFASPGPGRLNFVLVITDRQGRALGCIAVRGNSSRQSS